MIDVLLISNERAVLPSPQVPAKTVIGDRKSGVRLVDADSILVHRES